MENFDNGRYLSCSGDHPGCSSMEVEGVEDEISQSSFGSSPDSSYLREEDLEDGISILSDGSDGSDPELTENEEDGSASENYSDGSSVTLESFEDGGLFRSDSAYGSTFELDPLGFDPRIVHVPLPGADLYNFLPGEDEILERRNNTPVELSTRQNTTEDKADKCLVYFLLLVCLLTSVVSPFIYSYHRIEGFTAYFVLAAIVICILIKCSTLLRKKCTRVTEEDTPAEEVFYIERVSVV